MENGDYWVSSRKGTCWVKIERGVVKDTSNLWKRFKGQPFGNLVRWLKDATVVKLGK